MAGGKLMEKELEMEAALAPVAQTERGGCAWWDSELRGW
jgi:hypothetical protein